MCNTLPGATRQSIGAFQTGYTRLNARAKISEFTIDPLALDHGFNGQPAFLVKGDIFDALRLGGLNIARTGIAAIGGHLPGRIAI